MKKLATILFALCLSLGLSAQDDLFNYWYGVEWLTSNSDPDLTRIAEDMDCHLTTALPVHALIRGCLLNDNGTVNYYLEDDDWNFQDDSTTASDLTGADGMVMVEIPSHWEKFETAGDTLRVKIALVYHSGFHYVPSQYIGAYKAGLNRSTLELSSVVNATTTYRGGNNNAAWDAADNTLLGKPATTISRTNFRTYAQNRGPNWSMYTYKAWKTVFWLFAVEYATLNSQKAVNYSADGDGYSQGGLGDGVTTVNSTDWNTFSSYYPIIPCGTSDSLGNFSGEHAYSIPSFPGATGDVMTNRYRGIEDPFGDIWEWVDGINLHFLETEATAFAYVAENPNNFADESSYLGKSRSVLSVSKTSGYIKYTAFGNYGDLISSDAGTSGTGSSTYYCDYFYSGYAGAYWGWRALLVGGAAHYGSNAGLGDSRSSHAASYSDASFGSRLCFLGA